MMVCTGKTMVQEKALAYHSARNSGQAKDPDLLKVHQP